MVYINGNLFDSKADVLCHQVNLFGVMGGGIAAEIRKRFPSVYEEYKEQCEKINCTNYEDYLGTVLMVDTNKGRDQFIANCFCQNYFSENNCLTNYEKMEKCFYEIKDWMNHNNKYTVAFPYGIGCGIAGGNWGIVENIIQKVLDNHNLIVEIWKL